MKNLEFFYKSRSAIERTVIGWCDLEWDSIRPLVVFGISIWWVKLLFKSLTYSSVGIWPVIKSQKTASGMGSFNTLGSLACISLMVSPLNLIPSFGSREEQG